MAETELLCFRSTDLGRHPGIQHGFFGRPGGVSGTIYASLNCGLGSADDRANVAENRARAAMSLGLAPYRLVTCYQVHGTDVVTVDRPWAAGARPNADAMVTNRPGIGIGVLTADCAPVLAADPVAGVIGAAHAGWRGALAGVTDRLIAAMEHLGASRSDIAACVGPCISQQNYEVGPDLLDAFTAVDPGNARFFLSDPASDRMRFDLSNYVTERLRRAEIGHIEALSLCTYADEDRFFSFRRATHRGEADYGRALSAIALASR